MEIFLNCCFVIPQIFYCCLIKGWSALECIALASIYRSCCKSNKINNSTKEEHSKSNIANPQSSPDQTNTVASTSNQSIWEKMSTKINTSSVTFKVQSPLLIVKNPSQNSSSESKTSANKWSKVMADHTVMYNDGSDMHLAGDHMDEIL